LALQDLETRTGLPDALRVLLEDYPRIGWESDPAFDGMIQFWLDRHMMFRRIVEKLETDAQDLLDKKLDPKSYKSHMSKLGSMFVNQLHQHHQVEDFHYFPVLSKRDARIESGFGILDKDHHAIDHHLQEFVSAANTTLQTDDTHLRDATAGLLSQVTGFGGLLNRHLEDEEELVVPVLLKFGPVE